MGFFVMHQKRFSRGVFCNKKEVVTFPKLTVRQLFVCKLMHYETSKQGIHYSLITVQKENGTKTSFRQLNTTTCKLENYKRTISQGYRLICLQKYSSKFY